jgi:hypothetical protein
VPFPSGVDLQFIIKDLAKGFGFERAFRCRIVSRQPKNQNRTEKRNGGQSSRLHLFAGRFVFPKSRTAHDFSRQQTAATEFQQLVLRTFYLANADPKDVQKTLQGAIPAQPGRTPTIRLLMKITNSITIRDTTKKTFV